MKKLLYLLLLLPFLSFGQHVKYSVVIGDNYITVNELGELDTVSATLLPPKKYEAILTIEAALNPSIRLLRNDLDATITWSHSSTGVWTGTLTGAFKVNRTTVVIQQQGRGASYRIYSGEYTDDNTITVYAMNNSFTLADPSVSQQVYVSIQVYY